MTTVKKFEKAEEAEKREGQIQDFVSGHWVKASPESAKTACFLLWIGIMLHETASRSVL